MLNINKLKNLKENNHKIYHDLLVQISIHSDNNPNLLDSAEKISKQMNNMVEVINYLLQKENEHG
jgi:hypothetical protein